MLVAAFPATATWLPGILLGFRRWPPERASPTVYVLRTAYAGARSVTATRSEGEGVNEFGHRDYADLAAKVAVLEKTLDERLKTQRAEIDASIERLGNRLTIVVGVGIAFLGTLITLLALFRQP